MRRRNYFIHHGRRQVLGVIREKFVQKRQRVAHRPRRQPGNPSQNTLFRLDPFGFHDPLEVLGDCAGLNRPEVEALAPALDRGGHLLGSSRCQNELHVRRRLLQRLQQSVERPRTEHVHLIDDVDLEASPRRSQRGITSQLADVVHTRVARRIDLHHIEVFTTGRHISSMVGVTESRWCASPARRSSCR